jgi:protein-L-isoaspartate(D-aspartate) O-methyltransferase
LGSRGLTGSDGARGGGGGGPGDTYGGYRARLVEALRQKGIKDLAVLKAVAETPRHLFVPEAVRHRAYEDTPLPIGAGQTISQPFTQARYLEALRLSPRARVLEIGTGSGYQTALLAALADQVFTVERVRTLAERARRVLREAGVANVSVLLGDGTLGWSAYAPYQAILVAAGGPEVPAPLLEQLALGGRLLIPLGERGGAGGGAQVLTLVERTESGLVHRPMGDARFVPLIGEHGFDG